MSFPARFFWWRRRFPRRGANPAMLLGVALGLVAPACAEPLSFRVTLDPAFQGEPYTGRVYVIVSGNAGREPRRDITNWFSPPYVFERDVNHAPPGEPIVLSETATGFPKPLTDLPVGTYHVQAVARRSLDHPVAGSGPGDLYSETRALDLDSASTGPIELRLDRVVGQRPFEETPRTKLVEMVSPSLSAFHGREYKIRAAVVLPVGWKDDPKSVYPVLYMIPGFGGGHEMARFIERSVGVDSPGAGVMIVVPDPRCHLGHSVFADSANNGPWGWALVHELMPEIERRFHGAQSGSRRYVTGVSSGGWSSLWLQITYPEEFNGCWSHTPDPVDFRDFQRINLYEPGVNMYVDGQGHRRPLARQGAEPVLWYDDFVHAEDVAGPGGQIHSFEAVFSRRASEAGPELLFDRKTGAVHTDVAKTWERYDIRLILERHWDTLGPKLAGKLHIYGGEFDTFYLEGSVRLLGESLAKLGSDAEVKIIPGMGHGLYLPAMATMFKTIIENLAKHAPDGDKSIDGDDGGP